MKVFSGLIAAGCLAFAAAPVQACDAMHGGAHGGMSLMEMDKNGDGAISRKEFDAFHAAYFKELDADRDGKVTAGEIEAAHKKTMEKCDVSVDARFDETDVNGDGVLSRDEAEIGMPMLFARFDDIDTNKDGKISKDEVAASMKKMHEKVHGKPEEGGMKPIQK
jgi:Ca2+-binding EF-hand superfamily protein